MSVVNKIMYKNDVNFWAIHVFFQIVNGSGLLFSELLYQL